MDGGHDSNNGGYRPTIAVPSPGFVGVVIDGRIEDSSEIKVVGVGLGRWVNREDRPVSRLL